MQERDDIVAIDSAIILHPRVWEASGHVEGFTDPLVDCRTCKLRFRADKLEDSQCGRKPSKHPGEYSECDLTEPRAVQPHVRDARRRRLQEAGREGVPPSGDRPGHLHQLQERPPVGAATSRRSASRRSASRSATRSRRATSSSACASSSRWRWSTSSRPPRPSSGTATGSTSGSTGICATGCGAAGSACVSTALRSVRTTRSGTSDIEYLYPIGWSELEGVANRGDFDLTQHTEHSATKLEYVGPDGERYVPYVIEPAVSIERIIVAMLVDAYDEEVVAERERTVLRLHPAIAPVKAAILPLIAKKDGHGRQGAFALQGIAKARTSSSTTRAARSAGATGGRTRSARRGRSPSTSRRWRTTPSPSASATRSHRSASRLRACDGGWMTPSSRRGRRRRATSCCVP